jgi:hypothetical protein
VRAPRRTVRTIGKTRQALVLVLPQLPVHGMARHAEAVGHLDDRDSIADHREHRSVPLLHDTQLQQHAWECHGSGETGLTHHPEPRDASAGADVSRVRRNQTLSWWGGEDLNLRPTDYESAALTD